MNDTPDDTPVELWIYDIYGHVDFIFICNTSRVFFPHTNTPQLDTCIIGTSQYYNQNAELSGIFPLTGIGLRKTKNKVGHEFEMICID